MKLSHLIALVWMASFTSLAHAQQAAPAQPVDVEADQMEVRDAENIAIFTGSVVAVRGNTKMRADRMIAHYAKPTTTTQNGQSAPSGAFSGSEVTRIESEGNVRIEVPGQIVTGSKSDLDVRTDILTVTGQVTVTAGKSIVKGTKLVSDLKKKTSQMSGGRVSGSFVPGAK
jgi:lipopolysaccharide export system protein LptA